MDEQTGPEPQPPAGPYQRPPSRESERYRAPAPDHRSSSDPRGYPPEGRYPPQDPSPPPSEHRPPGPYQNLDPSQDPAPGSRRRDGRYLGGWALGVIVIVIGVVFLARNAGWFGEGWNFDNWWALFILIPAFGSLAGAWRSYRANGGRLGGDVARALMIGLVLLAVTVIFLLELDWGKVWPVLLVIVGLGLLLGWKRN